MEDQSRADTPVLEPQSRPETPVLEEHTEPSVRVRRKPGPKPRSDQPARKPKRTPGELTDKTREKLEKCKIATDKWLKDLEVPDELSLEKPMCLNILELNEYLICRLCKGYLYEASTITECMHTCKYSICFYSTLYYRTIDSDKACPLLNCLWGDTFNAGTHSMLM